MILNLLEQAKRLIKSTKYNHHKVHVACLKRYILRHAAETAKRQQKLSKTV